MNLASVNPLRLPTCLSANASAFSIPSRGPQQSAQIKPREAVSREIVWFESAKVRAGASGLIAAWMLLHNVNPARTFLIARRSSTAQGNAGLHSLPILRGWRSCLFALLCLATPAQAQIKCTTHEQLMAIAPYAQSIVEIVDLAFPANSGKVKLYRYDDGSAAIFYFTDKGCLYSFGVVPRRDIVPILRAYGGSET